MTHRKRFLESLLFGGPDRIPFAPGGPRESTLRAWHAQGLPENRDYMHVLLDLIDAKRAAKGLPPVDRYPEAPVVDPGVSFRMIPTFEEKIVEHKDGHYIVQDWMGAITEISDQYDYTYIRQAKDFVTRRWHKFPVQSWEDWEEMKWRFDPKDSRRFPEDFEARCAQLRARDYPFTLHFTGPFWQLREFCGFEGLCTMMLEQPKLVKEMARFWMEFCSTTMKPILDRVPPDMLCFSEDMCFKGRPMISPEQTRELCGPCYRKWVPQAQAAGTHLFAIDSDGDIGMLLPVWIQCGINCVEPVEVAAGNDVKAYRAAWGKQLAFRGGIDKRAIAAGGAALKDELERNRPVIQDGGFIPGCDHGVPPDISWPNFVEYGLQLAELTNWIS